MPPASPDFDAFLALAQSGGPEGVAHRLLPVCRTLLSDTLTPVTAYRRLVAPDPRDAPSFLFESVVGGDRIGRYSFLGARPAHELLAYGKEVTRRVHEQGDIAAPAETATRRYPCDDPLTELHDVLRGYGAVPAAGLPDFTGGWVGYAAYDAVRYLEGEKLPQPPARRPRAARPSLPALPRRRGVRPRAQDRATGHARRAARPRRARPRRGGAAPRLRPGGGEAR